MATASYSHRFSTHNDLELMSACALRSKEVAQGNSTYLGIGGSASATCAWGLASTVESSTPITPRQGKLRPPSTRLDVR